MPQRKRERGREVFCFIDCANEAVRFTSLSSLRHHRSIVPLGSVFLLLLLKGHLLCDLPWRRESQEFLYVWPEPRRAHDVDVGHAAVGEVLRVYSSLGRALDDPGGLKGELGHNEAAKAASARGGKR